MKGWILLLIVFIAGGILWPRVKMALGRA